MARVGPFLLVWKGEGVGSFDYILEMTSIKGLTRKAGFKEKEKDGFGRLSMSSWLDLLFFLLLL